jgi:hypothetical protein
MRQNVARGASGWNSDFIRQEQPYSESKVNGTQPMASQMAAAAYSHVQPISQYQFMQQQPGMYQGMQSPTGTEAYQDTQIQVAHSAAFDAAFAQAEDAYTSEQGEMQVDLSNEGLVAGVRLDPIFNTHISDLNANQHSALQQSDHIHNDLGLRNPAIRIGSDMIPQNDHKAPRTLEQSSRDHDELARTAGQLVNSVSGETSSKFENSQFLSLMRRIRDRQVEVRGDEFHDVEKNTHTVLTEVSEAESGRQSSLPYPPPSLKLGQTDVLADYNGQLGAVHEDNKRRLLEAKLEREEMMQRPGVLQEGDGEMMRETQDDVQALHPGGRGYPVRGDEDEDRHKYDHWASGGIGVEDERNERSDALAGRFRRVTVEDHDEA